MTPTQEIPYLGMILNSWTFRACLPPKKVKNCLQTVSQVLALPSCSAVPWMSLPGTLISVEQFVKLGRLRMRPLQFFLKANWCRNTQPDSFVFPITSEIKEDLQWWSCIERLQEGKFFLPVCPNLQFYSDASDLGWDALLDGREHGLQYNRILTSS